MMCHTCLNPRVLLQRARSSAPGGCQDVELERIVTFGIGGELLRNRDIPTKAKLRAGHAANFV